MVQAMVRGILEGPDGAKESALFILEGFLRDAATLAYAECENLRTAGNEEASTFYLREWSSLGCAADYVQGIHVAKTRPVTPQIA